MNLYSEHLVGLEFPYGIFLTNVIGSLAIGLYLHPWQSRLEHSWLLAWHHSRQSLELTDF
ncbi:uncharacterized protein METZ01_LOCUS444528 [marine metagenome]|uniref:Uncharacterized protein n=1 Tax=marine metagenome TaxID=408172 RepID=A0A382Z836_9ZZZZ